MTPGEATTTEPVARRRPRLRAIGMPGHMEHSLMLEASFIHTHGGSAALAEWEAGLTDEEREQLNEEWLRFTEAMATFAATAKKLGKAMAGALAKLSADLEKARAAAQVRENRA